MMVSSSMSTFAAYMARRESPAVRYVRRFSIAVVCVYGVLFWWNMFARIRQVIRIEARVPSTVLAPGSTVGYDIITSGEVPNRLVLELVQGERRSILFEQKSQFHRIRAIDPRVFRYKPRITLTAEMLAGFHAGAAVVRVTGYGEQKLLRTPEPRVREVAVRLEP
jgi:hypothetical protein